MIVITCECGQKMKVAPDLVGKSCKCVRCGAKLQVSEDGAQRIENTDSGKPAPESSKEDLDRTRIGQLLIDDGLINEEQLKEALAVQMKRGGRTFEILLSLGHLDKNALHDFLSRQSGVPAIDIKNYRIPRELISLVPKEFARDHLVIPIDKLGKLLTVAMACPLDKKTIGDLEDITGLRVKPMLSKLDDILATIGKYYPSEEKLAPEFAGIAGKPAKEKAPPARKRPTTTREEVAAKLARLESLPAFRETIQRVRKVVENPKSSIRDVAEIVCSDPPLVATLLSVSNGAAYGMSGRVNDINLAAAVLGIDGICEVVVSARIGGTIHESSHFDYAAFSTRSVFCATAALGIALACNKQLSGCARTAGFLHEIGRLALAENWPEEYAGLDGSLSGSKLIDSETNTFGLAHPEAGYILMQGWGIPAEIAEALRRHHSPESAEKAKELVAIVALAAHMAEIQQSQGTEKRNPFDGCGPLLESLGLDKSAATQIFTETVAAVSAQRK